MPNAKNIEQVAMLQEKASRAKSIVITKYSGLSVKQQTKLRSVLKNAGGEFIVAKNTLIARVLGKEQLNQSLQDQTGILFSYDDEVGALKELVKFAEGSNLPEIKEGVLGDSVLTSAQVMELSKIPGKNELMSMMLSRLNAPASKLVGVLNAGVRDLAFVLSAYQKKLGGNA